MYHKLDEGIVLPKYYFCTIFTYTSRKLVSFYNEVLKPLGITANQMIAIGVLSKEDGLTLGQFAERVKIAKSTATVMINRLERMGYVRKSGHPTTDKRLTMLYLTKKGYDLFPFIAERAVALENEIIKTLGPNVFEKFTEGLSAMQQLDIKNVLRKFSVNVNGDAGKKLSCSNSNLT